jgi:hypothetical protein
LIPGARLALALAATALIAAGCTAQQPAEGGDDRGRLLGGIPPALAGRGVYIFTANPGEDVSPGSLLAPVIGAALLEADLIVETGAPPVNLALGIESSEVPAGATLVGDVLVTGAPDDVAVVTQRLEASAEPEGLLAELAAQDAPTGWAGLPPTRQPLGGQVLITMDDESLALHYEDAPPGTAEAIQEGLANGAPPQSPGKPWSGLLLEPTVEVDGPDLKVTAQRGDLPGELLRQLIDSKSLSFLAD